MTVLPYKGVSIFNEDGTYRKEDDVVQGRSYSSNLTKLLKQHLRATKGKVLPYAIMVHAIITTEIKALYLLQ